ncbi:M48 family metalloprotease [Leadbettera azotonutricia]|uniref:Peptidase, M48 family n=1 Tax=Leadbettera azotonutricia (strain ATCC BAA-888 / DSM 13862 / ZAS-9) TaxID=545695 RepID=F5Y8T4_LEAAZ|nr:M48 family metalloprotease [Leadbettera azotonutricia]AEF80667.1 peptidase, M48 family [Leadbettera azotonutricia ZAS-9]
MKLRTIKLYLPIMISALVAVVFFSCAGIGAAAGIGAQIASSAGLISQNTADAIIVSGQAADKAFENITPEQEYYIGRAVAANILTTYKLYNGSPGLTAYLNRIANTITVNSSRPEIYNGYHLNILDSDEINAFATPGGHIFITRGLIACADSEDALAGVIAHEVGHILLQHSLEAIKKSRNNQAFMTALVATGGAATNTDVKQLTEVFNASIGEVLNTMLNSGFSRDQEFAADSIALSLMAGSGYEPSSLIEMLHSLEKNQASHAGGFNKTHPTPAQRIASAEKSVSQYTVADTRSFRQARYKAVK